MEKLTAHSKNSLLRRNFKFAVWSLRECRRCCIGFRSRDLWRFEKWRKVTHGKIYKYRVWLRTLILNWRVRWSCSAFCYWFLTSDPQVACCWCGSSSKWSLDTRTIHIANASRKGKVWSLPPSCLISTCLVERDHNKIVCRLAWSRKRLLGYTNKLLLKKGVEVDFGREVEE